MISIVACCHSVKLSAHAARAFPIATQVMETAVSGRPRNFLLFYVKRNPIGSVEMLPQV